jgi:hypothetical protein
MDTSLQDITQLIRVKEKELHEIHDQRCSQLEILVAERDNLLIESSKRFEQLRDDFQYNLALLEARDQEIERLETTIKQVTAELNESNAEKRALKSRIDVLEIKEAERFEKHEESKAANKVSTSSIDSNNITHAQYLKRGTYYHPMFVECMYITAHFTRAEGCY